MQASSIQEMQNVSADSNPETAHDQADQVLHEWMRERQARYQASAQATLTDIAQTVQSAGEMMAHMETRLAHLLQNGQHRLQEQQALLDTLRHELHDLRTHLAQERAQHHETLAQQREQVAAQIDQQHQVIRQEGAEQVTITRAHCEQIIKEADEEFQQVRTETQQWAAQLTRMQQTLQDMSGSSGASISAPNNLSTAVLADAAAPAVHRLHTIEVIIEGVDSITVASMLRERIEQIPEITSVTLQTYTQMILTLKVTCPSTLTLGTRLLQHLDKAVSLIEAQPDSVSLFYRG
jgi:hypothetical protein